MPIEQSQINYRKRMLRRLKKSLSATIKSKNPISDLLFGSKCEACGSEWQPFIRQGTNRLPNDWYVCPACNYNGTEGSSCIDSGDCESCANARDECPIHNHHQRREWLICPFPNFCPMTHQHQPLQPSRSPPSHQSILILFKSWQTSQTLTLPNGLRNVIKNPESNRYPTFPSPRFKIFFNPQHIINP